MGTKAQPLPQFIATDWLPATKRWSKTWACPKTGETGSGIYFPDDGNNFNLESTDGRSEIVIIKGDRNAPPDPNKTTLMLRIFGGQPEYQKAPDNAYINLNPSYVGSRYMTTADYEGLCTTHSVPVHAPSTLLDTYLSSKVQCSALI